VTDVPNTTEGSASLPSALPPSSGSLQEIVKVARFSTLQRSQFKLAMTFLLPALIVLLFIVVFPLGYNLWLSFHSWNLVYAKDAKFVWLANYLHIILSLIFWRSVLTTFYFGISSLVVELILAMLIALLLNTDFRGSAFVQTCVMLPMVTTPVAVSYVWRIMYNPDFGIIPFICRPGMDYSMQKPQCGLSSSSMSGNGHLFSR
jgi:ABC-type sugar transport system permease subunit